MVRLGLVRFGLVRLGKFRFGKVRFCTDRFGKAGLGKVRLGEVRLGHVRLVLQINPVSELMTWQRGTSGCAEKRLSRPGSVSSVHVNQKL